LKVHSSTSGSGHAALNVKDDAVVIDDATQGPALFNISEFKRFKSLKIESTSRRSRNVAFHDQGTAVVTGSDHSLVYIFDRRSGTTKDTIRVCPGEHQVQSIAVCQFSSFKLWTNAVKTLEYDSKSMILVGKSENDIGMNILQVWSKEVSPALRDPARKAAIVEKFGMAVVIVLAALFVVENILVSDSSSSISSHIKERFKHIPVVVPLIKGIGSYNGRQ
jgi:hypothetical protein